MKWYVQTNINEKDYSKLKLEIEAQSMSIVPFFHIPFSEEYPQLDFNEPMFIYAASAVTDRIKQDINSFAGVFAHSQDIDMKKFFMQAKEQMWSTPLLIASMEEVFKANLAEGEYFVRPTIDNKWFAGMTLYKRELIDWIEKLRKIDIDMSTEIVIAPISYPTQEYRLFAINGVIVTGSKYRENMQTAIDSRYPLEVKNFAQQFIEQNKNILPLAFAIDIAVNENGEKMGVIEINSINNSGFYASDKKEFVKALKELCIEQKPKNKLKV